MQDSEGRQAGIGNRWGQGFPVLNDHHTSLCLTKLYLMKHSIMKTTNIFRSLSKITFHTIHEQYKIN